MKKIISKKYGEYLKYEKEDDFFNKKMSKKELQKEIFKYLINGNNNFGKIIDKINNTEIQFRRISGSEYVMGISNNCLSTKQYKQKLKLASSINKLINYSSINYYSPLIHKNKHFPNGFNNYQGILKIDNEFYRYIVRIGITNKNISVFYDITLEIIKKEISTKSIKL